MKYRKMVTLKDGRQCLLRSVETSDAAEYHRVFVQTHQETDNLMTYPQEHDLSLEEEKQILADSLSAKNLVQIGAFLGGKLIGSAGIDPVGEKIKVRHRAEFGISILQEYWGCGVGKALTEACIACARAAGYTQLELEVVIDNVAAQRLYSNAGFVQFGINPRGFRRKNGEWQQLVLMRLEL